jgi:hypothetical protein
MKNLLTTAGLIRDVRSSELTRDELARAAEGQPLAPGMRDFSIQRMNGECHCSICLAHSGQSHFFETSFRFLIRFA